jgi:hypothetical protein
MAGGADVMNCSIPFNAVEPGSRIAMATMMSRKKLVSLDEAVAGMVLSQAVVDDNGAVLLPASTVLTDAMLRSLGRRAIEMLYVVDNDISEAELEAQRERSQLRLKKLFRKCDGGQACRGLLQAVAEYRQGEPA